MSAAQNSAYVTGREGVFEVRGGGELNEGPVTVIAEENAAEKLAESCLPGLAVDPARALGLVQQGDSDVALPEGGGSQIQAALFHATRANNPPDQVPFLTPGMEEAADAPWLQAVAAFDERDGFLAILDKNRAAARGEKSPDDVDDVDLPYFTLELRLCRHEKCGFRKPNHQEIQAARAGLGEDGEERRPQPVATLYSSAAKAKKKSR